MKIKILYMALYILYIILLKLLCNWAAVITANIPKNIAYN